MKKRIHISKIGVVTILTLLESCSKSNVSSNQPSNPPASNPSTDMVSGTWTITSLIQRSEDKTSAFKGFIFTFLSTGNVKADKNGAVTEGTWAYYPAAVGYYGSTPSKASFTINLGAASPFETLTKTWNIDSTKTNSSTLSLISPEVAENMRVTFSKN